VNPDDVDKPVVHLAEIVGTLKAIEEKLAKMEAKLESLVPTPDDDEPPAVL
jgi:hypothetical protein